jgi:hypothetical protein
MITQTVQKSLITPLTKRTFTSPKTAKQIGQLPRAVQVISITYDKLSSSKKDQSEVLEIIDKAYSENGLGTLAISGIP